MRDAVRLGGRRGTPVLRGPAACGSQGTYPFTSLIHPFVHLRHKHLMSAPGFPVLTRALGTEKVKSRRGFPCPVGEERH